MNTIILTIILTLVIYSGISLIVYAISKGDDDVLAFFGGGIFGWIIYGTVTLMAWVKKIYIGNFRYSVFRNNYDNIFYCKSKYFEDIVNYGGFSNIYHSIKKHTPFSSIEGEPFNKERLAEIQRNCRHCKEDKKGGKCYHKGTADCLCVKPVIDKHDAWFDPEMDFTFPHFKKN